MQLGRIRPIKDLIQSSGYVLLFRKVGCSLLLFTRVLLPNFLERDDEVLQIGWDPPVFYYCQMTYCSFSGGAGENTKVGY